MADTGKGCLLVIMEEVLVQMLLASVTAQTTIEFYEYKP